MKLTTSIIAFFIASIFLIGSAQADIAVNFTPADPADGQQINNGESFGVVPTTNWVNGSSFNTTGIQGTVVGLTTTNGAGTTGNYGGTPGTAVLDTAFRAGLRNFPGTGPNGLAQIDLTNLNAEFTNGYDVIVYITGFSPDIFTPLDATGQATRFVDIDTSGSNFGVQFATNGFNEITSLSSASPTVSGNFVRYSNLNLDTFNFTLGNPVVDEGTAQVAIGGFQVIGNAIPEPSSALLLGSLFLGLAARRRRG